ncbi:Retrovirus-related Pol poly from type-1 retrotransposable element R1, partial [Paramuricea clavata]
MTQEMKLLLKKVQRSVLLSMTQPLRSTPTAGLEVMMGLLPLDLFTEQEGHRAYWSKLIEPFIPNGIPLESERKANNWFPDKGGLEEVEKNQNPDVEIYTDGSRQEDGRAGCGWVACTGMQVIAEESMNMGDATIMQCELIAIQLSLRWLLDGPHKKELKLCRLWSDSQSAIAAIFNPITRSKLVREVATCVRQCHSRGIQLKFEWVKGHNDTTGNEFADYLAKCGTEITLQGPQPRVSLASSVVRNRIHKLYDRKWQVQWNCIEGHVVSKNFFPIIDRNRFHHMKTMKKSQLTLIAQAATGHGLFARHLCHWLPITDECRLCGKSKESSWHLWHECE